MDSYIYVITALLPLAASMLIVQTNPYHALVIRGILGAVTALVYTVLGAADVALTEALVGTLLAITLYAVAVRSSMVLRLGVLKEDVSDRNEAPATDGEAIAPSSHPLDQLVEDLRTVFDHHYLRVELIPYPHWEDLHQALAEKDVHAIVHSATDEPLSAMPAPYANLHLKTRLQRLYNILQTELVSATTRLSYLDPSNIQPAPIEPASINPSNATEAT